MLRELFEAISSQAVAAKSTDVVGDPNDPRRVWLVTGGEMKELPRRRPDNSSVVKTVSDLLSAVALYRGSESTIWVNSSAVVAVLDNSDRIEKVTLKLEHSDEWMYLRQLPETLGPRDMCVWMKRYLPRSMDPESYLLFRSVDFNRSENQSSVVKASQESLGKRVQSSVNPDLPGYLTAKVRVYQNPDILAQSTVVLSVDPNYQQGTFTFQPLAGEMEMGEQAALQEGVLEYLREHGDSEVFWGTPNFK